MLVFNPEPLDDEQSYLDSMGGDVTTVTLGHVLAGGGNDAASVRWVTK